MAHGNRRAAQLVVLWALMSIPSGFAQRSTFSNSSNNTTAPPAVANPNDISNGTSTNGPSMQMPLCTATQATCDYILGSSAGVYTAHTCCDMGSTCIPYGSNAGLCIPSAFDPTSCPKSRTCVPTSALDGDTNALLLGPQCCSSDEFCSALGCVKQIDSCDLSTICIPKSEPWGEALAYPIAAQCCKSGGTCSVFGCEYPDGQGQGASNSTGTGTGTGNSGSCSAPFTCAASNICVPTLLPDFTASANVIPAQCCTSGQTCGATGCHNNAFDGRTHPRRFKRGRGGMA